MNLTVTTEHPIPNVKDLYPSMTLFARLESISLNQYVASGGWAPSIEAATNPSQSISALDSREYRLFRVGPEHSRGYQLVQAIPNRPIPHRIVPR